MISDRYRLIRLSREIALVAIVVTATCGAAVSVVAQPSRNPATSPWSQCCGMNLWPQSDGPMGRGMMGGSILRHHYAMMSGIPAPYTALSNPLPRTSETVERGQVVYSQNCSSCHGVTGRGDGVAARGLSPPPADLVWLSEMQAAQWDAFMFWTVSEGGAQFGTAMPAFKDALLKNDIWAVIAYIQARLPQKLR